MDVALTRSKRFLRLVLRIFRWALRAFFAYLAILFVGLFPLNNDFVPAENGITIYLVSNAVHADIIVPRSHSIVDWGQEFSKHQFAGDTTVESHVAFGWGDRGFFLETETWDDLRFSTAANALLLPSQSCMHVSFIRPQHYSEKTTVTISQDQYERLVEFINDSFDRDPIGNPIQISGYAYSKTDAFFEAKGRYHLFNTCNSWVGRALKRAGVRVPMLSPMPKSPMLYIESEAKIPSK